MSFRGLKVFFQDVLGVVVSGGFLVKRIQKAAESLKGTHEKLVERLKREKHLHIYGWRGGEKRWVWTFRAEKYAVFVSRGEGGTGGDIGEGVYGNNQR
ncbi:hypothetical protein Holit_02385 [Hollandina sp. SP2]